MGQAKGDMITSSRYHSFFVKKLEQLLSPSSSSIEGEEEVENTLQPLVLLLNNERT